MASTIPLNESKSPTYYGLERRDVILLLEQPLGRVLDVGCGEGGAGPTLRAAGATWITGIELMPEPAERARAVYDEVLVGDALVSLPSLAGPFDTILCYDVLEHLYDPLSLVEALSNVATASGRLHVSVPNARHVSLLRDLVVRGTFGYAAYGHRDATHVRWFTRRDIVALIDEGGWAVEDTTPSTLHWRSRALARLTADRSTEYLAGQWFVLARRQ